GSASHRGLLPRARIRLSEQAVSWGQSLTEVRSCVQEPLLQCWDVDVARCEAAADGLSGGGSRSLTERERRRHHTDRRERLVAAGYAASGDHQTVEFGRDQGSIGYFVDIRSRRDVIVEGAVLRRRTMDIDRVSGNGDDVVEGASCHEVIECDLVLSDDPAGLTDADGCGGVEQPTVGHARELRTEELE